MSRLGFWLIIQSILITCLVHNVFILWGEVTCQSLIGFYGQGDTLTPPLQQHEIYQASSDPFVPNWPRVSSLPLIILYFILGIKAPSQKSVTSFFPKPKYQNAFLKAPEITVFSYQVLVFQRRSCYLLANLSQQEFLHNYERSTETRED